MFANNLNRLMAAKGWHAAHLAAAMFDCGVTVQAQSIQHWIDGRNEPRLRALPAIAAALGCTYADLLRVEEPASTRESKGEQMPGKGQAAAAAGSVSTGTEG